MDQTRRTFHNYNGDRLSFLDLPTEIRYMIYPLVLAPEVSDDGNKIIKMSTDAFYFSRLRQNHPVRPIARDYAYNNLSILGTCKVVKQEVEPLFWALTTFSFSSAGELNVFLKQQTILPGLTRHTNLESIQHVILVNHDINNHDHVYRDRVLTKLANGSSIVSLAIQHGDNWPCWCERCQDVQEVFDVEWEEQLIERKAEEERVQQLVEKHEATFGQDMAELEQEWAGLEQLFE